MTLDSESVLIIAYLFILLYDRYAFTPIVDFGDDDEDDDNMTLSEAFGEFLQSVCLIFRAALL